MDLPMEAWSHGSGLGMPDSTEEPGVTSTKRPPGPLRRFYSIVSYTQVALGMMELLVQSCVGDLARDDLGVDCSHVRCLLD
jgi:hypothetical protein